MPIFSGVTCTELKFTKPASKQQQVPSVDRCHCRCPNTSVFVPMQQKKAQITTTRAACMVDTTLHFRLPFVSSQWKHFFLSPLVVVHSSCCSDVMAPSANEARGPCTGSSPPPSVVALSAFLLLPYRCLPGGRIKLLSCVCPHASPPIINLMSTTRQCSNGTSLKLHYFGFYFW